MPPDIDLDATNARLARILREERERRGLSLNSLAAKAGLSRQMLSYVEQGKRKPTVATLVQIATAMGVAPALLIAWACGATMSSDTGGGSRAKRRPPAKKKPSDPG